MRADKKGRLHPGRAASTSTKTLIESTPRHPQIARLFDPRHLVITGWLMEEFPERIGPVFSCPGVHLLVDALSDRNRRKEF